ncbi:MAG: hypothetical protein LRS49_02720 [Desulfurococcales archaeon]|nr:hypothetical protein [Desulfurococcales archaeon]
MSNRRLIYENIALGKVLEAIGFFRPFYRVPQALETQQTPLERACRDLCVSLDARLAVVEFKAPVLANTARPVLKYDISFSPSVIAIFEQIDKCAPMFLHGFHLGLIHAGLLPAITADGTASGVTPGLTLPEAVPATLRLLPIYTLLDRLSASLPKNGNRPGQLPQAIRTASLTYIENNLGASGLSIDALSRLALNPDCIIAVHPDRGAQPGTASAPCQPVCPCRASCIEDICNPRRTYTCLWCGSETPVRSRLSITLSTNRGTHTVDFQECLYPLGYLIRSMICGPGDSRMTVRVGDLLATCRALSEGGEPACSRLAKICRQFLDKAGMPDEEYYSRDKGAQEMVPLSLIVDLLLELYKGLESDVESDVLLLVGEPGGPPRGFMLSTRKSGE